jgi:hypothetical protein
MKKIINTTLALSLLLLINGCKKDFLEVPPQGQLTEEQALIDPAAADKLVGGVYNTLYYQGTVGLKYLIMGDVTSDNSDKGSVESDNGFDGIFLDNFTHSPNTGIFNDVWIDHYKGIAAANKALDILNSGTYEENTKNRLIGEVRFIRGLYYFNLVRMFGGVPLVTRVPTPAEANNDEFQTRASKEAVYDAIEEDLQFGVTNLPAKGEAGAQVGRATKGAAQALLAKVFLYQGNWQGAFDMSQAVITSGKYDLYNNYANLFREVGQNSIESVFEVQTGPNRTGAECDAISKNYSNFQGPRGAFPTVTINGRTYSGDLGFGLNTPTQDLADSYDPDDVRREGTIIFTSATNVVTLWDGFPIPARPAVTNERYNYKGYHSPFSETTACNGVNDKDNKPKNIRLIRYAEVLLINAEAAVRLGQSGLASLQKVRARAGLTTTSATLNTIWEERRLELAMEGDRFFDLVRTGRAAAELSNKGFVAGKHELFPIPQLQRDLSANRLTQNPNY